MTPCLFFSVANQTAFCTAPTEWMEEWSSSKREGTETLGRTWDWLDSSQSYSLLNLLSESSPSHRYVWSNGWSSIKHQLDTKINFSNKSISNYDGSQTQVKEGGKKHFHKIKKGCSSSAPHRATITWHLKNKKVKVSDPYIKFKSWFLHGKTKTNIDTNRRQTVICVSWRLWTLQSQYVGLVSGVRSSWILHHFFLRNCTVLLDFITLHFMQRACATPPSPSH